VPERARARATHRQALLLFEDPIDEPLHRIVVPAGQARGVVLALGKRHHLLADATHRRLVQLHSHSDRYARCMHGFADIPATRDRWPIYRLRTKDRSGAAPTDLRHHVRGHDLVGAARQEEDRQAQLLNQLHRTGPYRECVLVIVMDRGSVQSRLPRAPPARAQRLEPPGAPNPHARALPGRAADPGAHAPARFATCCSSAGGSAIGSATSASRDPPCCKRPAHSHSRANARAGARTPTS
jgi:hypothetical protein